MDNLDRLKLECNQHSKEDFLTVDVEQPVLIFGAGNFGRDLCRIMLENQIQVVGFIETHPKAREVDGLPVYTWTELNDTHQQYQLAIAIFNRSTPMDELIELARQYDFSNIFMPWHLYGQFGKQLGWRYWLGRPDDITNSLDQVESVYRGLSDEISKKCLVDILLFRLGRDIDYASFMHDEKQYFNSLTLSAFNNRSISFVDGGAYNGDTYLELTTFTEVRSAYLFEPDPINFRQLFSNTKSINHQVMCLPLALSNSYSILSFAGDGSEGGAITSDGDQHIATVALDHLLHHQKIDFIKLDVEGSEINALSGAIEIIKRCRPVLAISLYHKPADVWEIPVFLYGICENYHFYIRQHYFNSFESVFYAIPA